MEPVQVRTPQGHPMTITATHGVATLWDSDSQPLAMAGKCRTDQEAIEVLCRQFGLAVVVDADDPLIDSDQPGDQGEADAKDDARYVYADDHQPAPRGDY